MEKRKVAPDYKLVKVDQTGICNPTWLKEKGIKACGVYYLIDVNLHVHICSLTPNLEAFPVQAWVDFESEEDSIADEGLSEIDLLQEEEPVSYFDLNVLRYPSKSAENYLPDREEDETDEEYYKRVPDAVHEYLCGNPASF